MKALPTNVEYFFTAENRNCSTADFWPSRSQLGPLQSGQVQQPSSNPRGPPVPDETLQLPAEFTEKYFVRRMLGRGSFGTVRSVIDKNTGLEWAAKIMPKQLAGKDPQRILNRIREEVEPLKIFSFTDIPSSL